MGDVELVIRIPEGLKKDFELEQWTALSCMEMKNALEKATPLPEGHGKLVDADAIIKEATEKMEYPANHKYMECVIAHMNLAPAVIEENYDKLQESEEELCR